jgi:hypothetical protein
MFSPILADYVSGVSDVDDGMQEEMHINLNAPYSGPLHHLPICKGTVLSRALCDHIMLNDMPSC